MRAPRGLDPLTRQQPHFIERFCTSDPLDEASGGRRAFCENGTRQDSVGPLLDEAINQLGEPDRQAILLRFFEQHDFRAVGAALGSNEDAARMRVTRALEKLRSVLKRRGVVSSASALSVTLSAHAIQAVGEPPGKNPRSSGAIRGCEVSVCCGGSALPSQPGARSTSDRNEPDRLA